MVQTSVVANPDPNPDPPDPRVFRTPGSGSFYHKAKIVRKSLISIVLSLCDIFLTLYLWKMMLKYLQKVIYRSNFFRKNKFIVGILKVNDEIEGSRYGSTSKCHGSATLVQTKILWDLEEKILILCHLIMLPLDVLVITVEQIQRQICRHAIRWSATK